LRKRIQAESPPGNWASVFWAVALEAAVRLARRAIRRGKYNGFIF
jgi:hypothetical protein